MVDQGVVKEIFRDVPGPGFIIGYPQQALTTMRYSKVESLERRDIGFLDCIFRIRGIL